MTRYYFRVAGNLALVVVLVASMVVPFAGSAMGATVYTETMTGSPDWIVIKGQDVTGGDVKIEISVAGQYIDGQNDDELIRRTTVTPGLIEQWAFRNMDAHEEVKVTATLVNGASGSVDVVTSLTEPTGAKHIGTTGGDADLECSSFEAVTDYTHYVVDCNSAPATGINTTELNVNETKINIYQTAQDSKLRIGQQDTTFNNYLDAYENEALIVGKNEYIRQLTNGSSESIARSKARGAVRDYWAKHQKQLVTAWNQTAIEYEYLDRKSADKGIKNMYVAWGGATDADIAAGAPSDLQAFTVTFVNDNTSGVQGLKVYHDRSADNSRPKGYWVTLHPGDNYGWSKGDYSSGQTHTENTAVQLEIQEAPYESGEVHYGTYNEWRGRWEAMQSSSSATVSEVDTFANNTYESYQDGDINTSDLVDPYVARKYYGPENDTDYQTWSMKSLSDLGSNSPETLSTTGNMTVYDNETGQKYTGMLLSQGLPQGDTYETGVMYNASNISGSQMVTTVNYTHELTGEFRIDSMYTTDGVSETSLVYKNLTYDTTTLDDYKQLLDNLTQTQRDINDRWELLNTATSGGSGGAGAVVTDGFLSGLFDALGFAGVPGEAVAVGGAVGGAYLLSGASGGSGGSFGRRRR